MTNSRLQSCIRTECLLTAFLAKVNLCLIKFAICYRRSVCRLSVVSLSVTLMSPTQPVEIFDNFSLVSV